MCRPRGRRGDSDDEPEFGFAPAPVTRRVRSATPERGGHGRSETGGKVKGGGNRTDGREMPKMYSIHKGTVVRIQQYGAFIRLGDGSTYKDGLLHISRLSQSQSRVDHASDVVDEGDVVWVKVVEVKEAEGKYGLDIRYVNQRTGEDRDASNLQAGARKGGGKGGKPEPIPNGAGQSKEYEDRMLSIGVLRVDEAAEDQQDGGQSCGRDSLVSGKDSKLAKTALKTYLPNASIDIAGSDSEAEGKKKEKRQHKKEKRNKKKAKKLKKQLDKLRKKQGKRKKDKKDKGDNKHMKKTAGEEDVDSELADAADNYDKRSSDGEPDVKKREEPMQKKHKQGKPGAPSSSSGSLSDSSS